MQTDSDICMQPPFWGMQVSPGNEHKHFQISSKCKQTPPLHWTDQTAGGTQEDFRALLACTVRPLAPIPGHYPSSTLGRMVYAKRFQ